MAINRNADKRTRSIKRVVALKAMALDQSSVHEAAIAKKRAEALIAKYAITDRELILAGWKPPKSTTRPPPKKKPASTPPPRPKTDQYSDRSHYNRQTKHDTDEGWNQFNEWKAREREEQRQWDALWRYTREAQQERLRAENRLEIKIDRVNSLSAFITNVILLCASPSLLYLFFQILLIFPYAEAPSLLAFISSKEGMTIHLRRVVVFLAIIILELSFFYRLKQRWRHHAMKDHNIY